VKRDLSDKRRGYKLKKAFVSTKESLPKLNFPFRSDRFVTLQASNIIRKGYCCW
jgi:hypothetical protein